MRCPKCGAFMEQGKDVCLMCGTNARIYVPQNNGGFNNNNRTSDGMFGSGTGTATNTFTKNYNQPKVDYRNVQLAPVKNGERDIFDFFSENKKVISTALFILFVALLSFIGYKYYDSRMKDVEEVPLVRHLYFEVDDSLEMVKGNNGSVSYNKTGKKGTECSINIQVGSSTSENHVEEWFDDRKKSLMPELDSTGKAINDLDAFTEQQSELTLNESSWHYMNIFYRPDEKTEEASALRYKYLTTVYKGYYYNITLINYTNDSTCNASLDNFARTLKFINVKLEDK